MIRTLLLISLLTTSVLAFADKSVRIGVLSFRSLEQTRRQWQGLEDFLSAKIPDTQFNIIPLFYPDMDAAATAKQVDFVFTNPEHYVLLRQSTGISAIATLMRSIDGRPVNRFGGVIFAGAENEGPNELEDLSGKTVAATDKRSFGGFIMQQWELYKHGVKPAIYLYTGMPHDNVVEAVLQGKADAGFVRTGVIEALVAEGKVKSGALRIVHQQPDGDFPQKSSTELYPEWPFSAMPETSPETVKAVALALLSLDSQEPVARTAKIYGFGPPGDYSKVEAVMLRLNIYPHELKNIQFRDVYFRYRYPIWAGTFFLLLVFLLSVQLFRANRRWRRSSMMYHLVADYTSDWEYWLGKDGELIYMSPSCQNVTGFTAKEFKRRPDLLEILVHEADKKDFLRHWQDHVRTVKAGELEFRITDRQGAVHWIHHLCRPVYDDSNRYQGLRASNRDITARKKVEMELRLHDAALKACADAIIITDLNANIQWLNPAFCELTGYSEQECIGRNPAELCKSGEQDALFYQHLWETILKGQTWRGEIVNRRKSGETYCEYMSITPVYNSFNRISHFIAVKQDISERKQTEQTIRQMAFYDPLTQLANRRLLVDRLEHAIASCKRKHRYGALLLLDLDRFKALNDLFGHDVGDQLLVKVANSLKSLVREEDTIARFGGDEFVVLLVDLDAEKEKAGVKAEQIARKIKETLSQHYHLEINREQTVSNYFSYDLSVSIGINLFRDAETNGEKILKQADVAMYQAKKNGRNTIHRFQ
ncbi:diguanylate cyclase domain-containing protein [Methylomonas sp. MgM2]